MWFKNETLGPFLRDLPLIGAWELLALAYVLVWHRYLLADTARRGRACPRLGGGADWCRRPRAHECRSASPRRPADCRPRAA